MKSQELIFNFWNFKLTSSIWSLYTISALYKALIALIALDEPIMILDLEPYLNGASNASSKVSEVSEPDKSAK